MVQAYYKGPLVLHMLRMLLRFKSGSDDLFVQVLRDFVHQYSGKRASTADFQRVLEHDVPGGWSWFFDHWIDGAEIPTLRWSDHIEPADRGYRLTVTVRPGDVGDDFTLIVPVRVDLEDGRSTTLLMTVNKGQQAMTEIFPVKPRGVVIGGEHSLLA